MVVIKSIFDQLKARVNPQSDVGIAFLNYLQAFHLANEPWRPQVINDFFLECLIYPHWQQNRESLKSEMRRLLSECQQQLRMDLNLEKIHWVTDLQVIVIERYQDQLALLKNHFEQRLFPEKNTKYRFFQDQSQVLGLILDAQTQQLELHLYDNRFTIRDGQLVPLRETFVVLFDTQINPLEDIPFFIELGPFIRGRFRVLNGLYDFSATRGYLFQKFQKIHQKPLDQIPRLFYPLKRIEHFFIKKDSNPFYVGLVQDLERAINHLRLKEPLANGDILDLLERARHAREYVFEDDKLLPLLIQELEDKSSLQQGSARAFSAPRSIAPSLSPVENGLASPKKGPAAPHWSLDKHDFFMDDPDQWIEL